MIYFMITGIRIFLSPGTGQDIKLKSLIFDVLPSPLDNVTGDVLGATVADINIQSPGHV